MFCKLPSPCSDTSAVQGASSVMRPYVRADRTQSTRTVPAGVLAEGQIQHVANHSRAMGDFPKSEELSPTFLCPRPLWQYNGPSPQHAAGAGR